MKYILKIFSDCAAGCGNHRRGMLVFPGAAPGPHHERSLPIGATTSTTAGAPITVTVSLYETACRLDPQNANLPVRLAQAYINSGNYTKAEYTLVSAITNNPESVQLYVALSKTYIEQDKILDAEQMLTALQAAMSRRRSTPYVPVRRFSPPKAAITASTLTSPSKRPAGRHISP